MRMLILALLLAMPSLARADLPAAPFALCRTAIAAAERLTGVPEHLMQAIGAVESGRRNPGGAVAAWPWTINAEGVGSFFDSKAEAMAAVTALRARGVRSIDVGCMQVNLMYHADAFSSLEAAFDPGANARYAGRFLQTLQSKTGSWPGAAAGYHSLTPDIGADYARKVLALWAKPEFRAAPGADGPIRQAALQPWSPTPVPPASMTMSIGAGARIIPLPASIAPAPGLGSGHGLDAYRAAPTRLAARIVPGRLNTAS
jgi:hypothetical protein